MIDKREHILRDAVAWAHWRLGQHDSDELDDAEQELLTSLHVAGLLALPCAYCGKLAEGHNTIDRDGFGIGPAVPLCLDCGSHELPTTQDIWTRIGRCPTEGNQ